MCMDIIISMAVLIKILNLKGKLHAMVFKLDQTLLILPKTVLVQLILSLTNAEDNDKTLIFSR